ncbi:MAG: Glycosyl transferase family 39 [Candidatus Roizmanbacteria bacterium GW2011_GWC2_34_23]|uniref:Glycosyl transferase family 39 n=2 Tax=Candidatus Roizmaniibacteriota TaxID=1752723 RepID=A0A0G0DJD2_9BACT|nr:MAG: Glycosyl transferase family 39 [Candidatus Roizmanbacteria bacterium GW2011_GWC2_34_23]
MKYFKFFLFLFAFFVFIYLRLTPIINKTVPYTYDQGRDFLKAEEIVRDKNLTFIGPTTGMAGVNHGAWWYYVVSIPYFLFNGNPISFYYLMFMISVLVNLAFFFFLKKEFNLITALFFLLIITISPYFIPLAFFASNNIVTPYMILALIICTYYYSKSRKNLWLFFIALSLGFVFEFEVSFGLFIIPFFTLMMVIFNYKRKPNIKAIALYFSGFIIPFLPRLLFEVKNGFIQTKTLINFFIVPKLHNPKPFIDVFKDRLILFWTYFSGIFYDRNNLLSVFILIILIGILIKFKNKTYKYETTLYFIGLVLLLFLGSLLYKDNFWSNYYEGIQYIFLFIIINAFYLITSGRNLFLVYGRYIILILFLTLNIFAFNKEVLSKKDKVLTGLKSSETAVLYVLDQVKNNDYCLRFYTPPVIPYTYNYLISYYTRINNQKQPQVDFTNNQCWFIVEKDNFQFRVKKWRKNNEPKRGKKIASKNFNDDYVIELWLGVK